MYTHFHMRGRAQQVAAHLSDVCAGLTDPPLDRMETEKGIMRTEAANTARPDMPL